MQTSKRSGIAVPAAVGFSVGVGATAVRAFQEKLGTPLGLIAGTALAAAVGFVAAIVVQYCLNRFSKPAE